MLVLGLAGCKDRSGQPDAGRRVEAVEKTVRTARELRKSFRGQEVWFIGGFMSQLYDALSAQLENEINDALERAARSLNVHLDLPGDRSLDIPIGDAIADALPRLDLPIGEGRFMSFYTQMRDFDDKSIPYRNVSLVSTAFNTSQSVEHNAAAIGDLLRNADKKIILVTHSKGGLDTLHALLGAPELWGDTVIGWVALQAPFYGSPLADSTPSLVHGLLLRALGGNGQAVEDLEVETRALYMQAHKDEIRRLTGRIPVITAYTTYESSTTVAGFASTFASGIFSAELITEITEVVSANYAKTPRDLPRVLGASTAESVELIRQRVAEASSAAFGTIELMTLTNVYLRDIEGAPNDGLVPKQSTVLPGATHRELTTGDHASPVMDIDPFKNFWTVEQRNEVTLALIDEVRRQAREARK
ncbi:MAG: hypothetical protein AMJ62_00985 [Myxococcales bacterium SG8_38]|nr:MAG: hypothetical protein AMJ62_00985 [Myxococcales bacterium SG8_38]